MKAIHVLFYKPDGTDHWINKLVSSFSPPYSHCDLQFDDETATSIYQNESVYMYKKTFSRINYDRISLTVTDYEYKKIFDFCTQQCKNNTEFDMMGMIGTFIPLYMFKPKNKTFCSRYIIEALQSSGKEDFLSLDSVKNTPSNLHTFLSAKNKSFIHIPNKRFTKCIV